MTILSTTLKNLKRRGFNVDRILNARKAEREAADQRMREERAQAQLKAAQALASLRPRHLVFDEKLMSIRS